MKIKCWICGTHEEQEYMYTIEIPNLLTNVCDTCITKVKDQILSIMMNVDRKGV